MRAVVAGLGFLALWGLAPVVEAESARRLGPLVEQYQGEEREDVVAQLGLWTRDELETATQALVETASAVTLARGATPEEVVRRQHTLQRGAVLLCHGMFDHGRGFDLLAPLLADRFRVVAMDARGHGESSWALNRRVELIY